MDLKVIETFTLYIYIYLFYLKVSDQHHQLAVLPRQMLDVVI